MAPCGLNATTVTFDFFGPTERGHFRINSVTKQSEVNPIDSTGTLEVALFIQTHCFHEYESKKQFLQKLLIGSYFSQ